MEFSPQLYHWFVRPKWFTRKYIHDHIQSSFNFENKVVLDFGSGTGANCSMVAPTHYLGMDPDSKRIDFARQLYPKYRFNVLRENGLPIDDKCIDYVLIVAVLHHIPCDEIANYIQEFRRILKPHGRIIAIEPYFCEKTRFSNKFMTWYDNGEYIRKEEDYLKLFKDHDCQCEVLKRFKKCFVYNELFFSAVPNGST